MSIITEFTIPAEAFVLEHTLEKIPDLSIEVERLTTHSREWVMPFLWAHSNDIEAVENALQEDSSIAEVHLVDAEEEVGYFNVHWSEQVQELIDLIVDQHGIMQEAEAANGLWHLKLQFVDQEALEEFQTYFRGEGYSFELQRMFEGTAPREREYDLTPEQYEVLETALEMGYFAIPRESNIEELAEELGISTNSVSERLRRATANLTRNTLTVTAPKANSETG